MAGPHIGTIWIERAAQGMAVTFAVYAGSGNKAQRLARVQAICARIQAGTWQCRWCGCDLPLYKRADAQFCRQGCRKRAARDRLRNQ